MGPALQGVVRKGWMWVSAPYGRDVEDAVPYGMGFRACGRGERIPTPVTSVTGSE